MNKKLMDSKKGKALCAGAIFATLALQFGCSQGVTPIATEGHHPARPTPSLQSSTASRTAEDLSARAMADRDVQNQLFKKQAEVYWEAASALQDTNRALDFLASGKKAEATAAIESAVGKFEVVLAREPQLGLVPVAISSYTRDALLSTEDVEQLTSQVRQLFNEGHYQLARHLLQNLASETVVSVTSLPLKSYPAALKLAVKQLHEGRSDEATRVLRTALSTQVITDEIIPLPLLRAEKSLSTAEKLAEKSQRTTAENEKLKRLLDSAEKSARFAESLGYGTSADFQTYFQEIEDIRRKTSDGKSGSGFFDKIKDALKSLNLGTRRPQSG
jgi:hypothetical protein